MPSGRPPTGVRRGPKPFPGTRRKRCDLRVPPAQPVRRQHVRHPRKRKTEVLRWLIHHRVVDARKNEDGEPITVNNAKFGQKLPKYDKQRAFQQRKDPFIYRPPTYREAEQFWKINSGTISHWWSKKEKYLSPAEVEEAKVYKVESPPASMLNRETTQGSAQQHTLNMATPSGSGDVQPQQTAVEISDDSDSDASDLGNDEDMPDIDTPFTNAESSEDQQMSRDTQELEQIFDDSDVDVTPNPNEEHLVEDQQGTRDVYDLQQGDDSDEDGEGEEDPELFGSPP
ncbi:hypothetical protein F4819DRAFT_491516 [Hypoxylon fuscum]|nr:hypothetical protein F4819DRAFT_491516 [Hypoxylon fuscum]